MIGCDWIGLDVGGRSLVGSQVGSLADPLDI